MKEEKKILLIHKVLTGVATQEELKRYDILKNQSVEDKQLVDDISYIWGISKSKSNNIAFDKAKAKARLFNRIEAESEQDIDKVSKVKVFNIQKMMSIAAVFVFLIAALFVFQKFNTKSSQRDRLASNFELIPGFGNEINSVKMYKFSDMTRVWTDENTKISVVKDDKGNNRIIKLSGNAFFEVSKDKNHPFVINVKDLKVKVLGTSFQIIDADNVEVDVYSGVVEFTNREGDKVLLEKGEGAIYDDNINDFVRIKQDEFSINTKESYLIFNDASLKTVFERLSGYFDVKINFDCKSIDGMKGFTSPQFAGNDIEYYLSAIEKVYDLSIVKSGNGEYQVKCD